MNYHPPKTEVCEKSLRAREINSSFDNLSNLLDFQFDIFATRRSFLTQSLFGCKYRTSSERSETEFCRSKLSKLLKFIKLSQIFSVFDCQLCAGQKWKCWELGRFPRWKFQFGQINKLSNFWNLLSTEIIWEVRAKTILGVAKLFFCSWRRQSSSADKVFESELANLRTWKFIVPKLSFTEDFQRQNFQTFRNWQNKLWTLPQTFHFAPAEVFQSLRRLRFGVWTFWKLRWKLPWKSSKVCE